MADGQGNLSIFPELVIVPDNASGSWNRFVEKFNIMVKWKTLFVKTQKFCAMRQAAEEEQEYRDYLVRVESLRRVCEFGSSENAEVNKILTTTKQRFCLHFAVVGLRDPELRKRIIAKTDLTWTALKTSPKALTSTSELDHQLSRATAIVVCERRNQGSSSVRSYNRSSRGNEARSP